MFDPGGSSGSATTIPTFSCSLKDAARVSVVTLDRETVAQIVWFLGDYQIQVNALLPVGVRAAVARHFVEQHFTECYPRHCSRARDWVTLMEVPISTAVAAS